MIPFHENLVRRFPHDAKLVAAGGEGDPINIFIHGYKSLTSERSTGASLERIARLNVPGRNYLLQWSSGNWNRTAIVAGLRASYRVARIRHLLCPWMLLVDAGVMSIAEVAQFKWMEKRSELVGSELLEIVQAVERSESARVNLIGHSLGARIIHFGLRFNDWSDVRIGDCVLLGGAADSGVEAWNACLAKIEGRMFNGFSASDRILGITPDLRGRVGARPMPQIVVDGVPKVVNHHCVGVRHVDYWSKLDTVLPYVWQASAAAE